MKLIRSFFILYAIFCHGGMRSQNIISSNTGIQTCIKDHQCFSINNASYLFYDESKSSFYLKLDFSKFKVGEDSIDEWLNDLTDNFLYFKAPMDAVNFKDLANNHHKTIKLHGQVFLNGIWQTQNTELSLYMTENGLLNQNNNQNNYDYFKVNFSLSILPKDFKVDKKPHHLKKTIFIGVTLGRINQLQPGMQKLLGEAYDH